MSPTTMVRLSDCAICFYRSVKQVSCYLRRLAQTLSPANESIFLKFLWRHTPFQLSFAAFWFAPFIDAEADTRQRRGRNFARLAGQALAQVFKTRIMADQDNRFI